MKKLVLATIGLFVLLPQISAAQFLKEQYVDGFNRICIYSTIQGDQALQIGGAEMCPMSLSSTQDRSNYYGNSNSYGNSQLYNNNSGFTQTMTGFLEGERMSGMNKICFYSTVRGTMPVNVKSYEWCPNSYRFEM